MIALYILYAFVALSLISGLFAFRYTYSFFKLLLLQTTVYAILSISLVVMEAYCEFNGLEYNNIAILNIHVGIEAILLFLAALGILNGKLEIRITFVLMLLFILVFIYQVFKYELSSRGSSLADIFACFTLSIVYAMVLYKAIRLNTSTWWKSPEILTSIGLFLYFAGSVPLISMTSYLIDYSPDLYLTLFYIINYGLANLRYFLLALSLYLIWKNAGANQLVLSKTKEAQEWLNGN